MSTKIYSGFRLPAKSAVKNFKILEAVRHKLQYAANAKSRAITATLVTTLIDRYVANNTPGIGITLPYPSCYKGPDDWPLFTVQSFVMGRIGQAIASDRRDPYFDCEIVLTIWVSPKGQLLGTAWGEQMKVMDILLATEGIESYGYWNNSDPEEGVSAAAWRRRGLQWDDVASETALPLKIVVKPDHLAMEGVASAIASFKDRVAKVTEALTFQQYQTEHERLFATANESGSFSALMELSRLFQQALEDKDSKYAKEYKRIQVLMEAALPQSLEPWLYSMLSSNLPVLVPEGLNDSA